jgi:hypothetical protein
MRAQDLRAEIHRLVRAVPFRPFVLTLENGERIPIGHPENIAFDPPANGTEGSTEFFVLAGRIRLFSTFEAITTVSLLEPGQEAE